MREAARFFAQALVPDPKTGRLISAPSNSPEIGGLVAGPTMDHQIIRVPVQACVEASSLLGEDREFAAELETLIPRIAPNRIGRLGQLQEWLEDVDDPNEHHRHVSHLWGVHPGADITWESSPELMKAARQSLDLPRRRRHGLEPGLEDQLLGPLSRRRPRLRAHQAALPGQGRVERELERGDLHQPLRLPPAIPDRRQFRRRGRHRRDAWSNRTRASSTSCRPCRRPCRPDPSAAPAPAAASSSTWPGRRAVSPGSPSYRRPASPAR